MANMKISALPAAAAVTGGEKVPAVQGGGNVAVTPEQLRTFARASRGVSLIVDGDSKGVFVGELSTRSALHWALARTGRIARYDRSLDALAVGSSVSGDNGGANTGLTSAGRLAAMAARVTALRNAGYDPVIILKIGANDLGLTAAETVVANVRKYWEAAKAVGAVRLLLMSVDPRTGQASASARSGHAMNAGYRAMAAVSPDVIFVDSHNALADPTNDLFYPIGGAAASGFVAMPSDGLHEGTYGAWLQSKALADALRVVGRPLPPVSGALINGVTGYSATEQRGNVLGNEGRFGGTGGAANVTLSGGGGVTGADQFPSAKLFGSYPSLSGALSGTLAVAISSVAYQPMADLDRPDIKATRLTFTGAPSAAGALTIAAAAQKPSGWDYTVPLDWDADLYCNALTGCYGLSLVLSAGGSGTTIGGADTTQLPPLNGRLIPHRPAPTVATADPANIILEFKLNWAAGVAMSGSIDLFALGVNQVRSLPAPTP